MFRRMQHSVKNHGRTRSARVVGLVTAALLGASALTGCAAGMISQTVDQVPNHDGAFAEGNSIRISNAIMGTSELGAGAVAWTAGSTVPLTFWVTNDAFEADTLTSVTSSVGEVTLTGDTEIPAQGAVDFGGASASAVISSISEDIRYGFPVDMDFYFADAGKISLKVTVANPPEREADRAGMDIYPEEDETIWGK